MGNGREQTIDKFLTKPLLTDEQRFVLVDSDAPIDTSRKAELLSNLNNKHKRRLLNLTPDNTFFMIQEVEAWIISQPENLLKLGIDTKSLPKCHFEDIKKPSEVLSNLYKKSGKRYNKITEFAKVFIHLNTSKLKEASIEFKELIEHLNS